MRWPCLAIPRRSAWTSRHRHFEASRRPRSRPRPRVRRRRQPVQLCAPCNAMPISSTWWRPCPRRRQYRNRDIQRPRSGARRPGASAVRTPSSHWPLPPPRLGAQGILEAEPTARRRAIPTRRLLAALPRAGLVGTVGSPAPLKQEETMKSGLAALLAALLAAAIRCCRRRPSPRRRRPTSPRAPSCMPSRR